MACKKGIVVGSLTEKPPKVLATKSKSLTRAFDVSLIFNLYQDHILYALEKIEVYYYKHLYHFSYTYVPKYFCWIQDTRKLIERSRTFLISESSETASKSS